MPEVISKFSELVASPCHTFLDEFRSGGEHVVVWQAANSDDLRYGGAIKAAPQTPPALSAPLDLSDPFDVPISIYYGAFDPYNRRILAWGKELARPSVGYLGLVEMPLEQIMAICVPLGDTRRLSVPLP